MQTGFKNLLNDSSVWPIIVSNIVTIFIAVFQGWNLFNIMLIYWVQSVIIGFFNFCRILTLKEFSTKGLKIGGQAVDSTPATKLFVAFFFAVHYGGFHIGYIIFIFSLGALLSPGGVSMDIFYLAVLVIMFFVSHMYSFIHNRKEESQKPNIGRLMFFPYARIIPMHLTIIFSLFLGSASLVFFLILKTFADVIMHAIEHNIIKFVK